MACNITKNKVKLITFVEGGGEITKTKQQGSKGELGVQILVIL